VFVCVCVCVCVFKGIGIDAFIASPTPPPLAPPPMEQDEEDDSDFDPNDPTGDIKASHLYRARLRKQIASSKRSRRDMDSSSSLESSMSLASDETYLPLSKSTRTIVKKRHKASLERQHRFERRNN